MQAIGDQVSGQNSSQARILHALQRFVQCHNRVFEVLFRQFQSRFISSLNDVFAFWGHKIPLSCLWLPSFSRGALTLLTCIWLPHSRCPFSFLYSARTIPAKSLPFKGFVDRLAECMPISINQRWSPSILHNVINMDTRFPRAHFLCSERQFLGTFPD